MKSNEWWSYCSLFVGVYTFCAMTVIYMVWDKHESYYRRRYDRVQRMIRAYKKYVNWSRNPELNAGAIKAACVEARRGRWYS